MEGDLARRDGKGRIASQHLAQGGFAGSVGTHYGVNLARTNLQVYAFQYFFSLDGCAKATHIEQYSVISVHR